MVKINAKVVAMKKIELRYQVQVFVIVCQIILAIILKNVFLAIIPAMSVLSIKLIYDWNCNKPGYSKIEMYIYITR